MALTLRTCAIWLGVAVAAFWGFVGLLMVPAIEDAYAAAVYTHLRGMPLVLSTIPIITRTMVYCMGDYLGCVKQEWAQDLVSIYNWEPGVGEMVFPSISLMTHGAVLPIVFSHSAYRSWAHDPKVGRLPDYMVASAKRHLPDGVLPDGEPEILLNFDTGSPEHTARRKLLADALPMLAHSASQSKLALQVPENYTGANPDLINHGTHSARFKRAVNDVVGYNLFQELFHVDVAENLPELFQYDATFSMAVLGVPLMSFQGRRLQKIRKKVMDKVRTGDVAKRFQALAKERGMDPEKRLQELVWIALFAGYGGTGNLAVETLKRVARDPARYVPLFRKDPRAFMLEAARLHPPVGGMNPMTTRHATEYRLATGRTLHIQPGRPMILLTSGANLDPRVFKDPHEFVPGRQNATKLLSWNNELDAFASCKTVAGCPAAPRGCPGTWLSLRLATAAVSYFVQGLEAKPCSNATAAGEQEL